MSRKAHSKAKNKKFTRAYLRGSVSEAWQFAFSYLETRSAQGI